MTAIVIKFPIPHVSRSLSDAIEGDRDTQFVRGVVSRLYADEPALAARAAADAAVIAMRNGVSFYEALEIARETLLTMKQLNATGTVLVPSAD